MLAVPLLTGDVDMTAIGTCTEVIGDRVFGFGHPFNNEGPVALPMGAGEINGVIANLMTSFKLGALTQTQRHALRRPSGRRRRQARRVAADGADRPARPLRRRVAATRSTRSKPRWHPQFTPLLGAMALDRRRHRRARAAAVHTLDYDLDVEFANGEKLQLGNTAGQRAMPELFFELGVPMMAAAREPVRARAA